MTDHEPDVRVLVVHGDHADLAVLASVVAAHAFDLRVLESSDDLAAEILRYQPDAVVLDVKQRSHDGYTICTALKSDPETAGVPVILTGSLDGPEGRRRAFDAGCDDFLEKPIHRHVLAYRLRSFARLRRAWSRGGSSREVLACLRQFFEGRDHDAIDPVLLAEFERWFANR
jgi:PleD family two-component response regulator